MKRFKIGDTFVNNVDHSKVSSKGYDHAVNYLPYTSEPDESLETIGKTQTVIDIEDGDTIITDFVLSSGETYWFEKDSSYAESCKKIRM